jgi:hypothetical protein
LLISTGGATTAALPATDVVAFVGNQVVDLAWDPVSCERYEVTRNGSAAGCTPMADPGVGKILCRDAGLTAGENYTYRVEAVTGDERTLVGEQTVTTGFVRGTLYDSLNWTTPGETYSLDGRVLVTNGAVLNIGSHVGVDKWSSPSEAAGIETQGTGGLQVTSGSPATSFTSVYLRLGADADFISGQEDSLVGLQSVSMHLTNSAIINACQFTGGSIEIVEQGGVPSFTSSRFVGTGIEIKATSSPVVFDNDRFGDPVLGDFWVHDGGQVAISDSLFAGSSGTGIEVGTDSVATITGNTFNIGCTGVRVWRSVGAHATISENIFSNGNPYEDMTAISGTPGSSHPHFLTFENSTIIAENNVVRGQGRGLSLQGGMDVEARNNSFVQDATAFVIGTAYESEGVELGSIRINNNCIASRAGGTLATDSAINVDATGNWWGAASGPAENDNPDGTGAELSIVGNLSYAGWLQKDNCAVPWRNLAARNMEVVQVVQTWDNKVPLVAGRPATVRVYPGGRPFDMTDVTGELTVMRAGATVGTLQPISTLSVSEFPGLHAGNQLGIRSDPGSSLNFKVPGAWVGGTMTFTVELNADRAFEEYNYADNVLSQGYTVLERPAVHLGIVPTNYNWDTGDASAATVPDPTSVLALADLFQKIYPSDAIDVTLLPTVDWPYLLNNHGWDPRYRHTLGAYYNTIGLSQMRLAAARGESGPTPDLVYGAFAPEDWHFALYDSFMESMHTSRSVVSLGKNYQNLFAYRQLSFLGIWGTPTTQADTNCYFYDVGYDVARDRVVGYGHDTCSVGSISAETTDPNRYWITVEHYQRLLDYSPQEAQTGLVQPAAAQTYVAVLANVSGEDEVELMPAWQFTSETAPHNPPVGDGTYCVELRDASEATLSDHCFDLSVTDGTRSWDHVTVALPVTGTPARVAILKGGTQIGEILVTPHAPQVTITASQQIMESRSTLAADGTLPLSWSATDADGETMEYSVLVSSDDRSTWLPVAANLEETSFELDLSEIPAGAEVWVRVEASDGFNVGHADYGPFALENHVPEVLIQAPTSGEAISKTQSLAGFAYDREDGQLEGSTLVWSSSIDGQLGNGALVFPAPLSEGQHVLTLSATDSAGETGSTSVTVTVGDVVQSSSTIYLPLVTRQ